jgi:hypothetical protein
MAAGIGGHEVRRARLRRLTRRRSDARRLMDRRRQAPPSESFCDSTLFADEPAQQFRSGRALLPASGGGAAAHGLIRTAEKGDST